MKITTTLKTVTIDVVLLIEPADHEAMVELRHGYTDHLLYQSHEYAPPPVLLASLYRKARDRTLGWLDLLGGEIRLSAHLTTDHRFMAYHQARSLRLANGIRETFSLSSALCTPGPNRLYLRWTVASNALVGELVRSNNERVVGFGIPLDPHAAHEEFASTPFNPAITYHYQAEAEILRRLEAWRVDLAQCTQHSLQVMAGGLSSMLEFSL